MRLGVSALSQIPYPLTSYTLQPLHTKSSPRMEKCLISTKMTQIDGEQFCRPALRLQCPDQIGVNTSSSVAFTGPPTPEFRVTQSPTPNSKLASLLSRKAGWWSGIIPQKLCTRASLGSYSPRSTFVFYFFTAPGNLLTRSQWFPAAYYGQGQRGHRYHVFDEVRPPKRNVVPSAVLMTPPSLCITESLTKCSTSLKVTLSSDSAMSRPKSVRASRGTRQHLQGCH